MRTRTNVWHKALVLFPDGTSSKFSIVSAVGTINAKTFAHLMHTAAFLLHTPLFAPTGDTFFGFDPRVLRGADPSVLERLTIQWIIPHKRTRRGYAGGET